MSLVDSLLVTLSLDASKFKAGSQQAIGYQKAMLDETHRTANQMESEGARAAEFFGKIKTEALSLFAVLLGGKGIESFIKDTTGSLVEMGKAALSIGESPQYISALGMAFERLHGHASDATAMLQTFASAAANARQFGNPEMGVMVGVTGGTFGANPAEMLQQLMKYYETFKDKPNGVQDFEAIATKIIPGISRAQLQVLETMGTLAEFNRQIAHSLELGVVNDAMIKHASDFQGAMVGLGQAIEHDAEVIQDKMLPGLTDFIKLLTVKVEWNNLFDIKNLDTFADKVDAVTEKLRKYRQELDDKNAKKMDDNDFASPGDYQPDAPKEPWDVGAGLRWLWDHRPSWNPHIEPNPHEWHPFGGGGGSAGRALPPDIEAEIRRQSSLMGLDADHMVRLAQKEGGPGTSPAGAFGWMQLMPRTAAHYGVNQQSSVQAQIGAGLAYYKEQLDTLHGNYPGADAAYNAGPHGAGVNWFAHTGDPSRLPRETQDYVNGINRPVSQVRVLPAAASQGGGSNGGSQITINTLNVNTQATDARGISRDIYGALVIQADRGPQ